MHQLKLLRGNGKPGVLLQIAGWHLQNGGGFLQFFLRFHPSAIGLAVAGQGGAIEIAQVTEVEQLECQTLSFSLCRRVEMCGTGRLGDRWLGLFGIERTFAGIAGE